MGSDLLDLIIDEAHEIVGSATISSCHIESCELGNREERNMIARIAILRFREELRIVGDEKSAICADNIGYGEGHFLDKLLPIRLVSDFCEAGVEGEVTDSLGVRYVWREGLVYTGFLKFASASASH